MKKAIYFPYGTGFKKASIDEERIDQIILPRPWCKGSDGIKIVKEALEKPIGSPRLLKLAEGKKNVVLVTCDRTRPVPSSITLPLMIDELEAGGVRKEQITILVATGLHQGEDLEELHKRVGDRIFNQFRIVIHDAEDSSNLVFLGRLSTGTPLFINRIASEADLLVVEGHVEPHFFAGFTGGSKLILPGLAGPDSILSNHRARNLDSPYARYNILENNPIRREADEAATIVGLDFALNIVLDEKRNLVYASCGEPFESFRFAASYVKEMTEAVIRNRGDIVITTCGGFPLDRNVYQAIKALSVGELAVKKGGVIIVLSECRDGVEHEAFHKIVSEHSSISDLLNLIRSKDIYARDQWQAHILARVLERAEVIFVTEERLKKDIESLHMQYQPTVEDALNRAERTGSERIIAIPYGPLTIPRTLS